MKRTKWLDRHFDRIGDSGLLPSILERLAGSPARIEEKVRNLSDDILRRKPAGKWSIKEEIGHLSDLEELGLGRLDDFMNRKVELRAADMSNKKTQEANHNDAGISMLLDGFRKQRQDFVRKVKSMSDEDLTHISLHPRLKTPMQIVDLAFFIAEHDDHHLAAMQEIIKGIRQ